MSTIAVYLAQMEFNRTRTLASLDELEKLPDAAAVLGWRPAAGRAHPAWQFLHIAVTEELFATERLFGRPVGYPELVARFRGGSTPDDEIPSIATIREVLQDTRQHLQNALGAFTDGDLGVIPEAFRERGWTLERILQVLCWHEAHHQGQVHAVVNLWRATHASK